MIINTLKVLIFLLVKRIKQKVGENKPRNSRASQRNAQNHVGASIVPLTLPQSRCICSSQNQGTCVSKRNFETVKNAFINCYIFSSGCLRICFKANRLCWEFAG